MEFRYAESGQPLSASFMDYLLPSASEMPAVGTCIREDAPSPGNPLGANGAGEGGARRRALPPHLVSGWVRYLVRPSAPARLVQGRVRYPLRP